MHVDTLSYSRPVILISPLTCGILYTVVWIIESILNVFTCKFYLHITVVHRQMQSILSPGAEQFPPGAPLHYGIISLPCP